MLIYIILGYISGSILYAPIWAKILHTGSITEKSKDKNPGTANAFMYGGVLCGVLTLVCELLKGYIPVRLCIMNNPGCVRDNVLFALVLCAPVIGHIFPILNGFHGGKGIAATFGCLLGDIKNFSEHIPHDCSVHNSSAADDGIFAKTRRHFHMHRFCHNNYCRRVQAF